MENKTSGKGKYSPSKYNDRYKSAVIIIIVKLNHTDWMIFAMSSQCIKLKINLEATFIQKLLCLCRH